MVIIAGVGVCILAFLHELIIQKSERAPTTGRVSSRCPRWFAPHTPVNIPLVIQPVNTYIQKF